MIKFKVSLKGIETGRKLTKDKAKHVLMRSMFKMEELAVKFAPHDQGLLREQISLFPEILASRYILKSGASHSAAMEYGTRPFYAPIDPLKAWAKRQLGDANAAYAVRAKIAKKGITAHPFMRPSLIEVKDFWLPQFMKEEFQD